ncbi:MAG: HNH endonuclease family protein [Treponema sp.]
MFYKMRLPNDDEMRQVFVTANFYQDFKTYGKFILGKIEEHNAKVPVDFRNSKITIEHIMPQTLSDDWKMILGSNYEQIYKKYLHNIGNLILTEFNSEIGNSIFKDKKEKLHTSSLYYRLEILNNDMWDESAITQHQANMINWFLETFPLPAQYQSTPNYDRKKPDTNSFSPADDDAGDWAEGNKPAAIIIDNNIFNVSTWQDVL